MRYLIMISLCFLAFNFKAQTYADIQETDSLPSRIVFYLPTADNDKLNLIKSELVKYPQIQSAVFYGGTHMALLIEFTEVQSTKFYVYADIKKQITQAVNKDEIFIKSAMAFDLIKNSNNLGIDPIIIK